VEFFEKKLDDLRQKFEENQKQMVSLLRQRIQEQPTENRGLYTQVENTDKQISDIDTRIKTYQRELDVLRSLPQSPGSAKGRQALDELQRADLPLSGDLHTVLAKRDELLQRYTPQYPEVQKLEGQLVEILDRMRKALETEISKQQSDLFALQQKRGQSINDLKQSSVTQRVDQDKEADYGIYQKLYDEMKVKLEQARTARDLGKRAANQFVVIDPAQVPAEATKPNRTLLIAGGFGLGLFMGLLAAVGAELMDTRVRSPLDVEVYGKPIIAFIPQTLE
jgi:succinoglycan biosynthesis transport protein ExoP